MKNCHIGLGISLIFLILTTLLLAVYASLSLVSANNDRKLTDRTVDSTQAYYKAEQIAQSILFQADELFAQGRSPAEVSCAVITKTDTGWTFTVPVDNERVIEVNFSLDGTGITNLNYHTCAVS